MLARLRYKTRGVIAFWRDMLRIVMPTYYEAVQRYKAPESHGDLFELSDHHTQALKCVEAACGSLDAPDFGMARKLFSQECGRELASPKGRHIAKVRKTLARWEDEATKEASALVKDYFRLEGGINVG